MRTITAAARELRVGKTRLYSLLTETGVEPFQQGKSRMIDDAQLQILQNAIHPTLDLKDDPERPAELTGRPEEREKRSSGPSESSTERSEPYKELVQRMSSEIDHLRELLTSERADRQKREDEVSTERQNYQQMLMLVQKDVQNLRQENDRLKLLEHTKPATTESIHEEEVYSRPPAEELKVEDIPPETIANRNSRGSLVGFGLSVAVIVGVLSYGAITKGGEWLSDSLENVISTALKVNGTEPDR